MTLDDKGTYKKRSEKKINHNFVLTSEFCLLHCAVFTKQMPCGCKYINIRNYVHFVLDAKNEINDDSATG